jgi:predicted MFS family arabinose efflux permease
MENKETKSRLMSGALFGFFQTLFMAFAMLIPTMYFSSLNISIIMFAFLLSIGDVFSFIAKPLLGHLTDRHGERVFLLIGGLVFIVCLFMIGQTTDILLITILKIISGIASALMFVTIFIYSLRFVKNEPDNKVGMFNGLSSLGWIIGFLIPGFFIDRFGISSAFYLLLVAGLVWVLLIYRFANKKRSGDAARPSFAFLKKTWKYIIFKTMDLAMFSAFVFFFARYALKTLGLSGSFVSLVVIAECVLFSATNLVVGRISNKRIRKYWLPLCIILHLAAATLMVFGSALPHYFIVAMLIGTAGGLIDIWTFSRISESFAAEEKGKVISTLSWNNDLATIVAAQVPVIFISAGLGTFTALYVFPLVMVVTLFLIKIKHGELG